MSQNLIIKIKGLKTNQNQLSDVEPGALSVARNINVDKDDIGESRRGFNFLSNAPSSSTRVDRLTSYNSKLFARRSNNNTFARYDDGVGWTDFSGTFLNPDDDYARMRFLQASGNLYFTTSEGIKVIDSTSGPVYSTGMPRGLDGSGSNSGASGFQSNNTQVAYRVVWGSKDANSNLYLGVPSQRIIVVNSTGGTRDVSLTFTIPAGITTSDFFQVYRSKESSGVSDEPNDELQLVYEENPTSGQISAKAVTFTDSTPASLMGAYLYTNSSQDGIQEANYEPPLANDIALFKGFTFFINVKTKHSLNVSLLAVSGSGLVVNDTITINGLTYTAKASETIASREFKVTTSGSAAQNIDDTAKSLIKVINQYTGNTDIYAYYESGYTDLPGLILLEKRSIDDVSFTVSVSRSAAWEIGDGTSDNESYPNGIMWSKDNQPEHVPRSHLELVGSKNFEGRRIIALRDSLFILKDDGIFRLTGSGGVWSIDPLDTSTKIIAPDSACVVNNQIFCLSDQGIVAVSDVGVEVKSRDIENLLSEIYSEDFDKVKKLSFGINYETDRKYIMFTISQSEDTFCTKAFVYNSFTNAWTVWELDCTHGIINPYDDKVYLAHGGSENVWQERKNLTFTDYVDQEVTGYNILSFSDTEVVLDSTVGVDIGDVLYQTSTIYSIITEINYASNLVTTATAATWSVAAATILKAIDCEVEFVAQHFGNPGVMKHFQEIALLFREKSFDFADVSFYTDLSGGYESTVINGSFGADLWGAGLWGAGPWGGLQRPKPLRVFVPREKSRGSLLSLKLNIKNAFAKWSLNGVSFQHVEVSERMERS